MSETRRAAGVLSRSAPFAAFFVARAVSLVGDGVGNLALVVFVRGTHGTGTAVGLLLLTASLPSLLSPLTGTVADRVDRRSALIAGELAQGALLAVVVVRLPSLPVLLVVLLAKSTIASVADAAGHSAVPSLVADEDLPQANALLGGLRQVGGVLGPLAGGLVVAWAGVRTGVAVDAGTFLVSVPLLLRLARLRPTVRPDDAPTAGVAADAWGGLRYTLGDPLLRALAAGFFLAGLAAADDIALPFLARTLGAGEQGLGVLMAAVGAGLVGGYAVAAGLGRRRTLTGVYLAGGALAALGNGLTGTAPFLVAAVGFQMTRGVGLALFETSLQTLVQRRVPGHLLGRVFANLYGAVNLAACIALLAGGPLLDATSDRTVLIVAGVVGLTGMGVTAVMLRGAPPSARPSGP